MKNILYIILLLSSSWSFAQVGVNNPNPDTTSILDLTSNNLGLLVPRMSSFNRLAISNPANALFVYDTDDAMFYFYDDEYAGTSRTKWTGLSPFRFRDDNTFPEIVTGGASGGGDTTIYMRNIYTQETVKNIGIGTSSPLSTLSINGNLSIGDATQVAPLNGVYIKGEVTIDDNVTITKTLTADSILAESFFGDGIVPVGAIIMWSGSTVPDDSWVICDGTVISDPLSAYNGQTSPNLSGRFIVGLGKSTDGATTYSINNTGGEQTHTLITSEMPSHNHGVTDPGHTHSHDDRYVTGGSDKAMANLGSDNKKDETTSRTTGSKTTGISINNTGGGGAHENRPPYYALAYIMRIK